MSYDPQSQQLLDAIAELGAPPLTEMTPQEVREAPAFYRDMVGDGPEVAVVRDIEIPGPAGPIPARVYEPVPEPAGTIVYYHGGDGASATSTQSAGRSPSRRVHASSAWTIGWRPSIASRRRWMTPMPLSCGSS